MSGELPSREEIERMVSERARTQRERAAERQQAHDAAIETGLKNARLVREFAEKARAATMPTEKVEVRGRRRFLRPRKSTVVEGWEIGFVPIARTEARWLIRPTDPPSWWKITHHHTGKDKWETVESVALHSNPGLVDASPALLRRELTDKLVELEEERRRD